MKPSEVRRHVLEDHEALRGMLQHLEALAAELLRGQRRLVGPLRMAAEELLKFLEEHMHWEDLYLSPALRAADAWGEERAARLAEDHREQRVLLRHILEGIRDQSRPPVVLARNLRDLVALLREDMDDEERTLVSDHVLRDDVVAIDADSE